MPIPLATSPEIARRGARLCRRRVLALGASLLVGGCSARLMPARPPSTDLSFGEHWFEMPDGTRLPYRAWLPEASPRAVMLALHGFNDSRDGFEAPAPLFAASGIVVYAPDQRGFGATSERGFWPGSDALVSDAGTMTRLLAARHPHLPLYLLGQSMGAAVLLLLASSPAPPEVAGTILVAPAVWGRSQMDFFLRAVLWFGWHTIPDWSVSGAGLVKASSDHAALVALGRDPLTLLRTRIDTVHGLVDLMSRALAAAKYFRGPGLIQYGGHDQLVPKHAMRAMWRSLPHGAAVTLAYYKEGYHLLLRDLERGLPTGDIVSWIHDRDAPLPSGAERAAAAWLAHSG